jgi:hypothetical protein
MADPVTMGALMAQVVEAVTVLADLQRGNGAPGTAAVDDAQRIISTARVQEKACHDLVVGYYGVTMGTFGTETSVRAVLQGTDGGMQLLCLAGCLIKQDPRDLCEYFSDEMPNITAAVQDFALEMFTRHGSSHTVLSRHTWDSAAARGHNHVLPVGACWYFDLTGITDPATLRSYVIGNPTIIHAINWVLDQAAAILIGRKLWLDAGSAGGRATCANLRDEIAFARQVLRSTVGGTVAKEQARRHCAAMQASTAPNAMREIGGFGSTSFHRTVAPRRVESSPEPVRHRNLLPRVQLIDVEQNRGNHEPGINNARNREWKRLGLMKRGNQMSNHKKAKTQGPTMGGKKK